MRPSPSVLVLLESQAHVRVLAALPAAASRRRRLRFPVSAFSRCVRCCRVLVGAVLALSGLGPRFAPLLFVFVLAATLAACCSAWFLDAVSGVSFIVCFNVLEWAALEADLEDYVSETPPLWNMVVLDRLVQELSEDGEKSEFLGEYARKKNPRYLICFKKERLPFSSSRHILFLALPGGFCATWPSSLLCRYRS